jgi:hypothetical protein
MSTLHASDYCPVCLIPYQETGWCSLCTISHSNEIAKATPTTLQPMMGIIQSYVGAHDARNAKSIAPRVSQLKKRQCLLAVLEEFVQRMGLPSSTQYLSESSIKAALVSEKNVMTIAFHFIVDSCVNDELFKSF